jgi:GST-like protein
VITLHGCRGCGSAAIEAALLLAGVPYRTEFWDWEDKAGWERLARINPQRLVPTLELPGGAVLAESVAILLWLCEAPGGARFAPPRSSPAYAQFLRWMVFLSGSVYTPIGIGDFPDRWIGASADPAPLVAGVARRIEDAWRTLETALARPGAPGPYLLGSSLSFLDVFAAQLAQWKPGPEWIAAHCPKIAQALAATIAEPSVARVWRENF